MRLIYNQYAVDEEDGRLFDLEDFMALTYPGDAHTHATVHPHLAGLPQQDGH